MHGLLPVAQARILGECVEHVLQHEAGLFHRRLQGVGAEHQCLLVQLALRNPLALGQRLFVALVAGLLVVAQLGVDAVQQRPRLGQHAVGAHALFQRVLVFGLQRFDRRVTFVQLRVQLAQSRIQLPTLGAHALQRLAQRGQLRAL